MDAIAIRAKIGSGLLSLFGHLPLNFLYGVGNFAAWIMNNVIHYRKREVYINLSRSFPDASYAEIREWADDYYKHLGEIIAETIWFGGCKGRPERLRKQNIYRYTNADLLLKARKERGVICMRSHMGNWEVAGGFFEYIGDQIEGQMSRDELFVAYKPMSNKVSDKIFYENRKAVLDGYEGMLKDSELLRHIIKHKERRPVYMVIGDQYPYKACHFAGTFLNQPTEGMLGAFSLAHKLGLAVVTVHEERDGRGHYLGTYEIISEDASKDDPEVLMREYFKKLEEDIRKDPANWLWSHRRWRKR